jgi:hypothetical protein
MVKKNLWIPRDEAEALRTKAFLERRSEAEIIRQGLRGVLGLDPEGAAVDADDERGQAAWRTAAGA